MRVSGLQEDEGGARLREETTVRESAGKKEANAETIAAAARAATTTEDAIAPENGAYSEHLSQVSDLGGWSLPSCIAWVACPRS